MSSLELGRGVLDMGAPAILFTVRGHMTRRQKAPTGEPERFFREVVLTCTSDECLIWPYARTSAGYGQMAIEKGRGGKRVLIHRYACEQIYGPPPSPHYDCAHSCGKGHEGCCNPKHLRWATRWQNVADAVAHGTQGRGHGATKLDISKVEAIKQELARGVSQRMIAKAFGVSQAMVSGINTGVRW